MIVGIYCIENKINNKKYIGKTKNYIRRCISHKSDLKRNRNSNKHLQNAWNRYGEENFVFYLIEECSLKSLNKREIYYINKYNTTNKEFGYNILSGGDEPPNFLGKKHSEKTKIKMSNSAKGNNRWLGRKHNKETKIKMSSSGIGLKKKNCSSIYMGVSFAKRNSKWACNIRYKKKQVWIGYFNNEAEAAIAYDNKCIELYGSNAKLNFPESNKHG